MIAYLSGILFSKSAHSIIINVGGVGYEVSVPLTTFYSLPDAGENVQILIYTHVKEDAIKLFGFMQPMEKEMFIKLIGVSGIGPKLAISILSGMETGDLISSLKKGDIARLNSIPGVGKKTAERLIVELRDKIKPHADSAADTPIPPGTSESDLEDTLSALVNLGYRKVDVEKALNKLLRENPDHERSVESLIRDTLKLLAR